MTAPDGSSPAGSLAVGLFAARQAQTPEQAKAEMTAAPVGSYVNAQDAWKQACARPRKTLADLKDGQNAIKHRLDLLDAVSGYGSAVMGYNWNIPHSQWIVIPFDTQLGPAKGVAVTTGTDTGYLTLKRGGLWRVDTHFTVTGYAIGLNFYIGPGGIPVFYNTYSPIFPKVMLEVVDAAGGLISATEYNLVSDLMLNQEGLSAATNAPRSGAFSKTFVLPDMPDEQDPAAPESWVHVRMALRYEPIYTGVLNETHCKILGGTQWSSLIATRWSKDATNINYADAVPDGGNLG